VPVEFWEISIHIQARIRYLSTPLPAPVIENLENNATDIENMI